MRPILSAGIMAAFAVGAASAPIEKETAKAVLVAKTKQAFVHVIPAAGKTDGLDEMVMGSIPGHHVVFTSAESGDMQILLTTRTVAVPTRRLSFSQTRLLGIDVDTERLYVLSWTSPRIFDRAPKFEDAIQGGSYVLSVYWLADGTKINTQVVKTDEVPAEAPKETTGKGPIKLTDDGASVYGASFKFKGKELVK